MSIISRIAAMLPTAHMRSVVRIGLDAELKKQISGVGKGKVLDVGSGKSPYMESFPHTEYKRLDIEKKNDPDICCSVTDIKWKSNYFDVVISTEVLEHIETPEKAVNEIRRVLKPGGTCILTTRFIHQYHPDPKDYYRFTRDSLSSLFSGFKNVSINPHGNRVQLIWHVLACGRLGLLLNILNPLIGMIRFRDERFPLGFVVKAIK